MTKSVGPTVLVMQELVTEKQLAERFGISVKKVAELRRRHDWPHVRFGRFDIRYTEEQVERILTMQTRAARPGLPGQTARSAARRS